MNERIKELKEQAILLAHDTFSKEHNNFWPIAMEKFAELIVRECAELVEYNSKGAGRDIREHFGVEQ